MNKKNIILMISDGYGPAGATFGRELWQAARTERVLPNSLGAKILARFKFSDDRMPLDDILIASMKTKSHSSLVTDSAAGATAFSCAIKTYNGAVAVDAAKRPCATIFEAAKSEGWLTGMVVKSRITHATPAAFNAHVVWRDYEEDIALQQIGNYTLSRTADLLFGGGKKFFLPTSMGGTRTDKRNLIKEAQEIHMFSFIQSKSQLLQANLTLPILGIFDDDHMPYEIDREPISQPGLLDLTKRALSLLLNASKAKAPFFLMIEGSRIDMASHSNDAATNAMETLEYQAVVQYVKQFVDENPNTIMISTSDHETGGMTLGMQVNRTYPVYQWSPSALLKQTTSNALTAHKIKSGAFNEKSLAQLLERNLGITDPTAHELHTLLADEHDVTVVDYLLGAMTSIRANVGFTTHGHTGVDVNLYAYGKFNAANISSNLDNTDLGLFLQGFMNLKDSVVSLTKKLQNMHFEHPSIPQVADFQHLVN